MPCVKCLAACEPGARYCPQCGTAVVATGVAATPDARAQARRVLERAEGHLHEIAGTEKLVGFSLVKMFSQVFTRHTPAELEQYFLVGTSQTTPPIDAVDTGWPKPWFFTRVLVFMALVYFGFSFAMQQFNNANLIPGLIMMGSLAVPLATVFLFFELNTPRNIAFYQVLVLVCAGGVVSLFVSLIGFRLSTFGWLGASQAGIVEEIGKLVAVVLIVRNRNYPYVLNGLLVGAAVGAGFAAFESAGYAFRALLGATGTLDAMTQTIQLRAFLTPFGHVAWTAIAAGVLWRVKGVGPFHPKLFVDRRFLKAFAIPVVLHMIWNAPLPSPLYVKHLVLGVVSWFVVFAIVQQGLGQVRALQVAVIRAQEPPIPTP